MYEIATKTGSMLLINESHCEGELWGLAVDPTNDDQFVTVGDDRTVRLWSLETRRLVKKVSLLSTARAVAWSYDGKQIAVGLGGSASKGRQKLDGAFVILNAETLEIVFEGRDSRQWISEMKFSGDGNTLAIGSRDTKIYLYDTKNYGLRAKCEKHNSYITHFDFAMDSNFVQSNCGAYELLFYSAIDGTHIISPSQMKDTRWKTQTCPLGWAVQGVWSNGIHEVTADVSTLCRSHSQEMAVWANDNGGVFMARYPCSVKEAKKQEFKAHASKVGRIRFTSGDTYVVSIGAIDRSVMQWKVLSS